MNFRLPARLGFACAISVAALAAGSVQAQDGLAVKSMLGKMGIIPEDKDPIRYRERAPLVLPPKSADLREPIAPSDYASSNPQWPLDPDVADRRRRDAESRAPATQSDIRRASENNPRLSPDELRRGGTSKVTPREAGYARGDNARDTLLLSPDQMAAGRRVADEPETGPAEEPRRRTLTEPPTGMRKSASGRTVQAIAGGPRVDQQALDASPMTWIRNQFKSSDDE